MDNSGAGSNKLIVLLAVAVLGAVGGQYLLNQKQAPAQAPWGQYPIQPPIAYAPPPVTYIPYDNSPRYYPQPAPIEYPPQDGRAPVAPFRSPQAPGIVRLAASQDSDTVPIPPTEEPVLRIASTPSRTLAALAPVLAGEVDDNIPVPQIAFVEDANVLWKGDDVRISGTAFNVYLSISGDPSKYRVFQGAGTTGCSLADAPVAATKIKKQGLFGPFPVSINNPNGNKATLVVVLKADGDKISKASNPIQVTAASVAAFSPADTSIRTNLVGPIRPVTAPTSINVYGNYLTLSGTAKGASTVDAIVCRPSDYVTDKFEPIPAVVPSSNVNPTDSTWVIPVPRQMLQGPTNYLLAVRMLNPFTSQHQFALGMISITRADSAPIDKTKSQLTTLTPLSPAGNPVDLTRPIATSNSLEFTVASKVPMGNTVSEGYAVLVQDGLPLASTAQQLTANETMTHTWKLDGDGKHELALAIVQGDRIDTSPSKTVDIRRDGPRPVQIFPENLGLTPGKKVIEVQFTTPVNTANASLFSIDKTLTVSTATVDGNRVRLELSDLKPDNYTLIIRRKASVGGTDFTLKDVYGNELGKSPNQDVDTFRFSFVIPIDGDVPTSRPAGINNLTGPFVPYQEFTDPRPEQKGFNPSDKVVTRVSRLYYFRDAHRVLQIIKRDAARSYNRQAVTMQQQLKDKAIRDVENAVAMRQQAERSAVESARKSRAAETALNQFQQALVTARNQQADADAKVTQSRTTVTQRQREFEDATDTQNATADELKSASEADKSQLNTKLAKAKLETTQKRRVLDDASQQLRDATTEQTSAAARVVSAEQHVTALLSEVQATRNEELQSREKMDQKQTEEDNKQKELFRREIAAATEDPDTYAPGNPTSSDPIEQVSLSVIGEGLIQMRGPLKGVNLVRTMINEIDAPVGQVKVAIHTVQVNGEHGNRMEPVIGRIQRYIDHSRFLTTQSAQMLRNAVTTVASRQAERIVAECESQSQEYRDQKYIAAFFGQEFIDELSSIDSEFLHSGNKLLCLHSMDSTSLANALFLLALAKNDVRREILLEFEKNVSCKLPQDEMDYFQASNEKYKFGPPLHKSKFQFLGHNAKFVSLRGFFDVDVEMPDTLTPLQREFVRLAQIFKSRLVTELEWQQRVMERSLIEDRGDVSRDERRQMLANEKLAQERLAAASEQKLTATAQISNALETFSVTIRSNHTLQLSLERQATVRRATGGTEDTIDLFVEDIPRMQNAGKAQVQDEKWTLYSLKNYPDFKYRIDWSGEDPKKWKVVPLETNPPESRFVLQKMIADSVADQQKRVELFKRFSFKDGDTQKRIDEAKVILGTLAAKIEEWKQVQSQTVRPADVENADLPGTVCYAQIISVYNARQKLNDASIDLAKALQNLEQWVTEIVADLDQEVPKVKESFERWGRLRRYLHERIVDPELRGMFEEGSIAVQAAFKTIFDRDVEEKIAKQILDLRRRPLDHKKFLDMLIDDVEDKFIELMEGTRAHTANIDNYLSRLGQSLEDDFNTQFYFPAFKGIREASRFWDVQLGAVESTSVLTNNRTFAKVSPQATMEFDLPKRDLLITEAFKSAQAAYDDYGALLGDPTFLSLAKMYRGQPTSALFGNGDSVPTTRNVLPGLPSSSDEKLVAQARAVAPDFPSALESLIPDPAVYKFETGTGFEVRPVIQPDGQAVVFHLNYMYTTNVREPVRADEKHLGRVKRHFIDTDVQTGNYEMREVSRYQVALKASRTSRGVPLLEDVPVAGVLFRPLPSQESSLQENLILAQSVIYPTLFDLMGLRWAPAVAELDALRLQEADFVTRGRQRNLRNRVFDFSSQQVDEFLRIDPSDRRSDLYRSQETIPSVHPNGFSGPGLNVHDSHLQEEYDPRTIRPDSKYIPGRNPNGAISPGTPMVVPPDAPLREVPFDEHVPPAPTSQRSVLPKSALNRRPQTRSDIQLQSYEQESKPAARTGPVTPPKASRPASGTAAKGASPATSGHSPEPVKPAVHQPIVPAGMTPADFGFSNTKRNPAVPLERDVSRSAKPKTNIVPLKSSGPAAPVELESATKKRTGVSSLWVPKPADRTATSR